MLKNLSQHVKTNFCQTRIQEQDSHLDGQGNICYINIFIGIKATLSCSWKFITLKQELATFWELENFSLPSKDANEAQFCSILPQVYFCVIKFIILE